MHTNSRFRLLLAAAAIGVTACTDATTPNLISDSQVSADVAASSGDAIATDIAGLIANEAFAGMPSAPAGLFASPPGVSETRSRTCFDAQDVQQQQCDDQTTAKVVLHWTLDGGRAGDHFSASIHRIRDLTISGLAGTETSRTHDGVGTSNDTTVFAGERITRTSVESAIDSVKSIVFNLPHATNPWPVSGSVVRRLTLHITVEGDNVSESRDANRRVEVIFPADAQGNVTINVNDKTCTLNLVTRAVVNCSL